MLSLLNHLFVFMRLYGRSSPDNREISPGLNIIRITGQSELYIIAVITHAGVGGHFEWVLKLISSWPSLKKYPKLIAAIMKMTNMAACLKIIKLYVFIVSLINRIVSLIKYKYFHSHC